MYFVKALNHLPPIKWVGSELSEFFDFLKKMIKEFPSNNKYKEIKPSKKEIEESLYILKIDTEQLTNWEKLYVKDLTYDWNLFLRYKNEGGNNNPYYKRIMIGELQKFPENEK